MIDDWDALLHEVAPHGKDEILDAMAEAMPTLAERAALNTPRRVSHALAQWFVESQGYTRLEENLNYSAKRLRQVFPRRIETMEEANRLAGHPQALAEEIYGGRKDLGNVQPGDGYRYRGSGITQTTGRANFKAAGYEDRPDDLRRMPGAIIAAVAFWQHKGLNALADTDSVLAVSKRINGGTNGLEERKAAYRRIAPLVARHWNAGEAEEPEESVIEDFSAVRKVRRLSQAEVKGLQKRLAEMGYREVGKVDGLWGGRTAGALVAFKTDKGLRPLDAATDEATMAALREPFVRPVAAERATATATSLAAQGSVIAKQGLRQKAGAWLTGAGATVYGVVSGAGDYWSDAQGYIGSAKGLLTSVPDWAWILAAAGIAYFLWTSADKTLKARVDDERSGKTA